MKKALEGERRWTTVLFTDMVNFSSVSERIGAENVYNLLSRIIAVASSSIENHGGHVVDYAGDSILAAFGAPIALENASLHACKAAKEFLHTLERESDSFQREFDVEPQFRVGISGGTIILGHLGLNEKLDVTVMGEAVNLASRLEAQADPGQVLISDSVHRQVEGFVSAADCGEMELKGFAEKQQVYRLENILTGTLRFEGLRRRGLVELIGRKDELEQLVTAARNKSPGVRTIAVSALAGLGKSRLIHEFREILSDKLLLQLGQCHPSTQQVALGPFLEIIRNHADIGPDASKETIAQRLSSLLPEETELNDFAAVFTGGDKIIANKENSAGGEEKVSDDHGGALRVRRQMQQLLLNLGHEQPIVLIIEDAHWIDGVSEELLEGLCQIQDEVEILLILTHRPDYDPSWAGDDNLTQISLKPLDQTETRLLAEKNFETSEISPNLMDVVASKAEGNPLFAEEIIRFLKSGDRLQQTQVGLDLAADDRAELLSGNLQHLVLSRVDTLSAEIRANLQVAATIGRNFSALVLERILNDLEACQEMCERCAAEGLIEPDPQGLEKDWRFTHALINDAIYNSMLSNLQSTIHARIATDLEVNADNRQANMAEVLAYHFGRAKNAAKAVKYLAGAAENSIKIYAVEQAANHLKKAFGLVQQDPDCVGDDLYGEMLVVWLRAMEISGDFGSLISIAEKWLPRMQEAGYSANLSVASTLVALSKTHARDYQGALAIAEGVLSSAEQHDDLKGAAWAKVALMRIYEETCWEGRETMERLAAEIRPVAQKIGDNHISMMALYLLSSHYRSCGEVTKAKELAGEIRDFALKHDDQRALAYSCWALSIIYNVENNGPEAIRIAEQGLETALPGTADASVNWACWTSAQVYSGDPELAREKIDQLIANAREDLDYNLVHSMEWTKAILEIKVGHLALGWKMLEKIGPVVDQAGNATFAKHLHLIRGEILLIIAGLINPSHESPRSDAQAKPKLGLLDILTGIRLRFSARKRAAADFEYYCRNEPLQRGASYARAQIGLGIIAKSRGDKSAAQRFLDEGRALAAEESLANLVARADRYLSA